MCVHVSTHRCNAATCIDVWIHVCPHLQTCMGSCVPYHHTGVHANTCVRAHTLHNCRCVQWHVCPLLQHVATPRHACAHAPTQVPGPAAMHATCCACMDTRVHAHTLRKPKKSKSTRSKAGNKNKLDSGTLKIVSAVAQEQVEVALPCPGRTGRKEEEKPSLTRTHL